MEVKNRNSLWIGLAVLVVIIGAAMYTLTRTGQEPGATSDQSQSSQSERNIDSDNESVKTDDITIEFSDNGFDRDTYAVKPGATVVVRNSSSQPLQFSSDSHPTHRDNPELNTPTIGPGQITTFTAPVEPGEYGFHDHIDASHRGVIIVR